MECEDLTWLLMVISEYPTDWSRHTLRGVGTIGMLLRWRALQQDLSDRAGGG